MQIEKLLIDGCRRLAEKGFLNSPADSVSMRAPGEKKLILATGITEWKQIESGDVQMFSMNCAEGLAGLHATIYQQRGDTGAIAIASPKAVRMLSQMGGQMPVIFDEQARHIGRTAGPLPGNVAAAIKVIGDSLRRGSNATLLGEQLLCLGMTCERVVFNSELYEKCAEAYVLAKASGFRICYIPLWVRLIANGRLLKDEGKAAASYQSGTIPEGLNSY
jgi:ribulose-5-phosphate 4-epimerase/fuculose-1-phosphate aldolase